MAVTVCRSVRTKRDGSKDLQYLGWYKRASYNVKPSSAAASMNPVQYRPAILNALYLPRNSKVKNNSTNDNTHQAKERRLLPEIFGILSW